MKRIHQLLAAGLACSILTLSVGCENIQNLLPVFGQTGQTDSDTTSLTGLVVTQEINLVDATQSKTVPAKDVVVQVLDSDDKEIANTKTDVQGLFFIRDIKANQTLKVVVASEKPREIRPKPGRIIDLGQIQISNTSTVGAAARRRVTGALVAPDGKPISGASISDKEHVALSTQTDESGSFSLDVLGTELRIETSGQVRTVTVEEVQEKGRINLDVSPNTRTLKGVVLDKGNTNLVVPKVKIKVPGTSLTTISDEQGNFTLLGAPLSSFTLEAEEITGYKGVVETTAAGDPGDLVEKNILMIPVGSIMIHVTVANSPSLKADELLTKEEHDLLAAGEQNTNFPEYGCRVEPDAPRFPVSNCSSFLGGTITEYDNKIGLTENVKGVIAIGETHKEFIFPPAPIKDVVVQGAGGSATKIGEVRLRHNVVSILVENLIGGPHTITVSMEKMQTQKSLVEMVPSNDVISTEVITMHRATTVKGLGDLKGKINGVEASKMPNVRVNYVDVNEGLALDSHETQSILLKRITTAVTTGQEKLPSRTPAVSLLDTEGNYLLQNVPTGSRIVVAGVITKDDTGADILDNCYIPNSSSILNVNQGVVNLAPNLVLTKRPLPECQ